MYILHFLLASVKFLTFFGQNYRCPKWIQWFVFSWLYCQIDCCFVPPQSIPNQNGCQDHYRLQLSLVKIRAHPSLEQIPVFGCKYPFPPQIVVATNPKEHDSSF
ncbi:hypothetical protein NE237_016115 [Protea cynaroides]|uniref:Uncharacterized protein n=1 Tax=Protea cynaroides TaxID=273540 RepID=A0A9Q0KFL5_9MAGN|nr:hypothetical protein NE237_016115 [Protea cynaroides]